MATKTFPERFRAEFFSLWRLGVERWKFLATGALGVVVLGSAVSLWWWQAARREGAASLALAEVNQAFRKQYPAGFFLPGGEKEEVKPEALIERYQKVASDYAGTAAGVEALLRAGDLEYGAGRYDAAVRSYDGAGGDRRAVIRATALLGKGYALLAKGDGAGAVAAFGQAAEAAPKDPVAAEAYLAQGRTLETLGKREEALRAYAEVTGRFPGTSWAQQANERTAAFR